MKPSNVLVQRSEDGALRAKVMDFGLAHDPQADEHLTRSGAVLGTPAYMSPEQARGDTRSIDRRSDIYSLGAMLYELLTLQPPFCGASTVDTLLQVINAEPRPLRQLAPTVPRDLETIAYKCLEKTPNHRYESAQALCRDLQAYLDGKSIIARPRSLPSRLFGTLRRHRLLLAVSMASLVALAALSVVFVRARLLAARKLRIEQRFGEQAREIESIMQQGYLAPLHNLGRERRLALKRLQQLEAQMRSEGAVAIGPGHYALGRGYLAMQDYNRALAELEVARRDGYETAGLSYALGRTLAELYRSEWARSEFINDAGAQKARRAELGRIYREPAIAQLVIYVAANSDVGTGELLYVQALLSYCHGDYPQALRHAQQAVEQAPWLYEARRLEGDTHMAVGLAHVEAQDFVSGLSRFEQARTAYEAAEQFARSDALVRNGLAQSWMHTFGSWALGLGREPGTQMQSLLAAVEQSLVADPQQTDAYRIQLEGYQYLLQYLDVRDELGPEVDTAIELADKLRQTRPELTPILIEYYLIKNSNEIEHGLDVSDTLAKFLKLTHEYLLGVDTRKIANPGLLNEAVYSAGALVLKVAVHELAVGRDPAQYYPEIELWIGELRKIPAVAHHWAALRGRYLTCRGEALLKQGSSPVEMLRAALAVFDLPEGQKIEEVSSFRSHAYALLLEYQLLTPDGVTIDLDMHAKIQHHVDDLERDKFHWLWKYPSLHRFFLALAKLELHAGRDPEVALKRLENAIGRCQQASGCRSGDRYLGQLALLRARWRMAAAHPDAAAIDSYLQAAERHLTEAQHSESQQGNIYRIAAELKRWQSEWSLRQRRPTAVARAVQQGLQLAARALRLDPLEVEALALAGTLQLQAARAAPGTPAGRSAALAAVARIEEAVKKNPLLHDEYEPLRREAVQRAGGPAQAGRPRSANP